MRSPSPGCPPSGRAVGLHYPRAVGVGVRVWGGNIVPLACMPSAGCVPRVWWGAVPGGSGSSPLLGASGVRRCPSPSRLSSGAGSRGSATHASRVRLARAWGPSTGPKRASLRAGVVHCRGGGRVSRGGGAFCLPEGRPSSGAPPPPAARPLGRLLGSATHMLWVRVCGCGGPALSPWLACPVGAACRGGGGEPLPRGVACHLCEGCLVSGALPPPAARPLGRAARVPRPVCPGCGWGSVGTQHQPWGVPVRPCGLALLALGVAEGCPGGGAFRHREWRLRSGALRLPAARPPGGLSGSSTHVLWAPVCGCGAQHCPLGVRALWGLRAAGVVGAIPGGGGLPF